MKKITVLFLIFGFSMFTYSQNYNSSPIQYGEVKSPLDIDLMGRVLMSKQATYNKNLNILKTYISKAQESINQIENSEIRTNINNRFNNEVISEINRIGYDLSSNKLTQDVLNFIYSKFNEIKDDVYEKYNETIEIKNKEIEDSKPKSELSQFLVKYIGNHIVYKIEDYTRAKDGKWELTKIDNNETHIILENDEIKFKRSTATGFSFRELFFLEYISKTGYYIYSSSYGDTYIDEDFKVVIFYDKVDEKGKYNKRYFYHIKN